ncbi:MAG: DUF1428 domain-containing protein [Gammaproteobacteria bacterium]
MYLALLIIPVPAANLDAYQAWARNSVAIFKRYGCIDVLDGWEDAVPRGTRTDLFRAVDARPDEKIVMSCQLWPDRATLEDAEARMHADHALDVDGEPPFDASRLIMGCFRPLG